MELFSVTWDCLEHRRMSSTAGPCLLRTRRAPAESLQSCPTLCDPADGSPPGSPVPGILQQEHWSGLPFPSPNAWKWKVKVKSLSRVWLVATPWTAAYQAPPSMGFSRQEYWSGLPLPSLESKAKKKKRKKSSEVLNPWTGMGKKQKLRCAQLLKVFCMGCQALWFDLC